MGCQLRVLPDHRTKGLSFPVVYWRMTSCKNGMVVTGRALLWRHIADAVVFVLHVVPVLKCRTPLARNPRLVQITEFLEPAMKEVFKLTGIKQRQIGQFSYSGQSWATERRVITRLEFGEGGNNPRYVVTDLSGMPPSCKMICIASVVRPRTESTKLRWVSLPPA